MNLNNNIDFDLKRFFFWWGKELSLCLPEKLQELLNDKSGYVFLSTKSKTIELYRFTEDAQKQAFAEIALNENSQEHFQKLIANDETLENAHYVLRLNSDQALKKTLYLPAASKENLRQVVEFELDKYTPFNAEQVYFAVKQLDKEENGWIKVLLVLTPKETLDSIYLQLINAQIYPTVVDFEDAANNFSVDLDIYNLLPEWERPVKNRISRFFSWFLGFVALLLSIAVLVFPVWHEGQTVDLLREQLTKLNKDTSSVQASQLEIDNIVDETTLLINTKNNAPSLIALINTISKLIADDSWLTHFKFNKGQLQIQGQAPTASSLIGVLEASPLFKNARFVSPLTQDKRTGMERFQISMDVNIPEANND